MLCRANTSSVSQVGLDATTPAMLFSLTGGVSFCAGVRSARGSFGEPKVTPPSSFTHLLTLPPPVQPSVHSSRMTPRRSLAASPNGTLALRPDPRRLVVDIEVPATPI